MIIDGADWLVLDERGGKTLLLAKDIIEKHPYNDTRFCAAWEASTLCGHLSDERFLLNIEEAKRYFMDDAARIALWQGKPWAWWLCDMGIKNHAAFVGKDGLVSVHGYRVDCAWCGVRPAIWVKTEGNTQ
jgi:hypothetical protein